MMITRACIALGTLAALDFGQTVQFVVIAIGLAAALAVGRSKRKDALIADFEKSEARLEKELTGTSRRAEREHELRREAEKTIERWQAKYEEQSKYTAKEAFETIVHELSSLRTAVSGAISSQGELILKNTELQAQAVQTLERVATDLEVFADRLRTDPPSPPATDPDS